MSDEKPKRMSDEEWDRLDDLDIVDLTPTKWERARTEIERARASEKRLAEMLRAALDAANERLAPDAWRQQMDLVEAILSGAVRNPLCRQCGQREVGDERAGWATPVCLECLPLPRRAALSEVEP